MKKQLIYVFLILVGLLWIFVSSQLDIWKVLLGILFIGLGIAGFLLDKAVKK